MPPVWITLYISLFIWPVISILIWFSKNLNTFQIQMKNSTSVTVLKSTYYLCLCRSWVAISWVVSKIERYLTFAASQSRKSQLWISGIPVIQTIVCWELLQVVWRSLKGKTAVVTNIYLEWRVKQAEKKQLFYRLKCFDGSDCERGSTNRCTMEDLKSLTGSFFLKQYMITLFDTNFYGRFYQKF